MGSSRRASFDPASDHPRTGALPRHHAPEAPNVVAPAHLRTPNGHRFMAVISHCFPEPKARLDDHLSDREVVETRNQHTYPTRSVALPDDNGWSPYGAPVVAT